MSKTCTPGPTPTTVRAADGSVLTAPDGWALLPPGDAALTRRVKEAGDHWVVQEKRGRKVFSRGVWAPAATIDRVRAELEAERATDGYARRRAADARRRDRAQADYVEDFHGAVLAFLAFHPAHADLAGRLARAVTEHATPVGSGTVARTRRIPVEERAEAAVIAWMRHQTTGYDGMVIPRVKGKRREVRRVLAFAPDGTTLATGSPDGSVRLWDVRTMKQIRRWPAQPGFSPPLAFRPDGKCLAAGGDEYSLRVWDAAGGGQMHRLPVCPTALAYSPDGRQFASLGSHGKSQLWDGATGKELSSVPVSERGTGLSACSADGRVFAFSGWETVVWGARKNQRLATVRPDAQVFALALSPDGRTLATGDNAARVCLWDAATGRRLRGLKGHAEVVSAVGFSPDGRLLASGGWDRAVRVWEVATGTEVARFVGHAGRVKSVAFAPDGARVASGGDDGVALVWDAGGGPPGDDARGAEPGDEELEKLWEQLADAAGAPAYRAAGMLARSPRRAVEFLKRRLTAAPPEEQQIARWVAELDDARFAVRTRAAEELARAGPAAAAALGRELAAGPALEVRRRMEAILDRIKKREEPSVPRERLRLARAVAVLEQVASPGARRALEQLAGAPDGALPAEVRAALERLNRRPGPP